ncbi:hypothetical protein T03_16810 [Trichinella britovi]|uniref:Uncharacterized protein n=1 Tax=Trichinella britovi TaxID=45882 RepID=A0A0V1C6K3_TRIBR|nr:hypothetical protein T03_16810 [Trichinella britovi]
MVSISLWQSENHDADHNPAHCYFSQQRKECLYAERWWKFFREFRNGQIKKCTKLNRRHWLIGRLHGNEASNEADVLLASWTADVVNFCLVIGLFEQRFQSFRRTSSATSTGWQACCGVVMEGL